MMKACLLLFTLSTIYGLPPLGTIVSITPTNDIFVGVRHCSYVLSTTQTDPDGDEEEDFVFRLVTGLNGLSGDVSFQSVNFPTMYVCAGANTKSTGVGLGEIGAACATKDDASFTPVAGLADAKNTSLTSSSQNPLFKGLYLTRNNSVSCPCCARQGSADIVLAYPGSQTSLSQTWIVGQPPPPPPGPPQVLVVHTDMPSDHRVKEEYNGCHSDPGYTQEPLGWHADLVYGNAFQPSPASKIPAWNDITAPTAQATCTMDPNTPVNPSLPSVPSLQCVYASGGSGVAGWSNRGIGNEGLYLVADAVYEGFVVVKATSPATLYVGLNNRDLTPSLTLASASIPIPPSPDWQVVNFTLTTLGGDGAPCIGFEDPATQPTIDCGKFGANPGHVCVRCGGEFVVGTDSPGTLNIGYSTLMPGEWGRYKGLPVLKGAMDAMEAMGIKVIRQGGTVSQSFVWKEWRGAPWERRSMGHTWGDSLIGSWGLFEFIDMCNAADIEPVVTLAYDTNSAEDWADLVEYLYGNESTTWGAQRFSDGHPNPYYINTLELGNEQENPDFVAQVSAVEARRKEIGAPEFYFMYPTNDGVDKPTAASLSSILDASFIMPDCHVGGGGGVDCALNDFAANPTFLQSFINCETNAAISDMNRAIQEAADLQAWFNLNATMTMRLRARTASFCSERSGHFEAFDQGITFFLPNGTWFQPPGYVHTMVKDTWVEGANGLLWTLNSTGGDWLKTSSQISDDGATLVVHLVNTLASLAPGSVQVFTPGFTPASTVSVLTLQVPDVAPGDVPLKTAGNTPANPTYISPQQTTLDAGGGGFVSVTLPPFSYTILVMQSA